MWVMMHAEQSYLNRDYSILEQKRRCMQLYHILSWFTIVWFYHDVWFWHVFAEFWHRLHWLKTPGLMPSIHRGPIWCYGTVLRSSAVTIGTNAGWEGALAVFRRLLVQFLYHGFLCFVFFPHRQYRDIPCWCVDCFSNLHVSQCSCHWFSDNMFGVKLDLVCHVIYPTHC